MADESLGFIDNLGPVNWAHPLNRGLVSWWLPIPGWSGGALLRDLCRKNDGTLTNGPTWAAGANGFQAVSYNGSSQFTRVSSALVTGPPMTLAAWVYHPTSQAGTALTVISSSSDNDWYDIGYYIGTDRVYLSQNGGGGSGFVNVTSAFTPDAKWHLIVGVWASAASRVLYHDGVSVGSDFTTPSSAPSGLARTTIGTLDRPTATQYFSGSVGAAWVYNRALSASEVAALYQQSQLGHPETLNRVSPTAWFVGAASRLNTPDAHYKLDESAGANNALDDAGGSKTLTQAGSPGSAAGKLGTARTLNGTTQFFTRSGTDFEFGTGDWSISVWVNLTNTTTKYICFKGDANLTPSYDYELVYASSRFKLDVFDGSGSSSTVTANAFGAASSATWYHVAVSFTGATKAAKIWVNNVGDSATLLYNPASSGGPFVLGGFYDSSSGGGSSIYAGSLDELTIWKGYALTSSDVTTLYGGGTPPAYTAGVGFGGAAAGRLSRGSARMDGMGGVGQRQFNPSLKGW